MFHSKPRISVLLLLISFAFSQHLAAEPPLGQFVNARPSNLDGGGMDGFITMSGDGRTAVFASARAHPDALGGELLETDLYLGWREPGQEVFRPRNVIHLGDEVNSPSDELGAGLSSDGLTLVFGSRRLGPLQLFVARRPQQFDEDGMPVSFTGVELLDERLDDFDGSRCWHGQFNEDDSKLYLSCYDFSASAEDIAVAEITWEDGEPIVGDIDHVCGVDLNTPAREMTPCVRAGGRAIFFSETVSPFRPGGHGNSDIWFAWRDDPEGCFGPAEPLIFWNDGSGAEWGPFVTRDWPATGSQVWGSLWEIVGVADWVPAGPHFVRGDCNDDGNVELSDAQCILDWLFITGVAPGCIASGNANGDDAVGLADAAFILNHLFLGGPAPAPPYPGCAPSELEADRELRCRVSICP